MINSNFDAVCNYKNNENYSYPIILLNNLPQLSNFIAGKKKEIEFNIPVMKLHGNNNLKLKEKILSMANEERKELGINESMPWCMKKNLKEGKTISIRDKVLSKIQTLQ